MSTVLKPCPFCGGEAGLTKEKIGYMKWIIGCSTKFCRGHWRESPLYDNTEEAEKAWNRRVNMMERVSIDEYIKGRTVRRNIVKEIIQERNRQVTDEGYSLQHDDELDGGQLAEAGSVYASTRVGDRAENYPSGWVFKPTERRRELIKAAALIMAEIERLDRRAEIREGGCDGTKQGTV